MDIKELEDILYSSKEYKFDETVLTIKGYYTGKQVRLDLGKITQEMLDELIADEEEEEF